MHGSVLGWFGWLVDDFGRDVRASFVDVEDARFLVCEGGVDVVGVVTPLVRGGAQVLHGDQVVELSVLLEVHEKEEVEEDGEGQIEVESGE